MTNTRKENYKSAYDTWQEKTEWVQETAKAKELGMHRADVLKRRIADLEDTIRNMAAVIAKKDEGLRIAIEYQEQACQYFHDAMAGYKEHEHQRYRDDLKEIKDDLALTADGVELVDVRVEDHLCAVITESGGYTKYNGPTVYTIKQKP